MTRVKCANCGNKFEVDIVLDDNMDHPTSCPDCNWLAAFWNFDVVLEEEVEESLDD